MAITRKEVKAMINALAPFVHTEYSTMEFRLISPEVYKSVKNFAGIMNSMAHNMCHDICSLFDPYTKSIRMFSNALADWTFGKQMNFGEIARKILEGEFNFPPCPQKMDETKVLPEARLRYEVEWASFHMLKGICEVWEEAAKYWVKLDSVRHQCRCTIVTALTSLKSVAMIRWCIENQAIDRIDEEIKRVKYKSLAEIADEPFWNKRWSEQYANWEQEIG